MADYQPFSAEEEALRTAVEAVRSGEPLSRETLADLAETYRRLLRDARRLVRISDRREAQLRELNQTMAAQREELREARDAAEAADRAKSAFLAAMSHEIRTPMNGVLGMVELLAETALASEQREMVATVQGSAQALLYIINDILDFSKIEAGRMDLEAVPLSLQDLVEDVGEMLAVTSRARDVRLVCDVDPAIPKKVVGDPVRLRQVLYNLGGNAVKFTATTAERQGLVRISARRCGNSDGGVALRLAVEDNGIGIDAEAQKRLFQPFAQADSGTTRRFGGTGLGLTIVRRLVELMGGQVTLDSAPGVGSTFVAEIALPAHEAAVETPPLQSVAVAVIGDDVESREVLTAYLAADGASVRDTADGADVVIVGPDAAPVDGVAVPVLRLDHARGGNDPSRINAGPVRRGALVQAILVALGRAPAPAATSVSSARRPAVPTVEEAAAAGRLILVADDDATNRNVILRQLRNLGFAADTVADGREALAAMGRRDYALLLSDCHMPKLDGYGLARQLRAGGADLPILAVTADVTAEVTEQCHAAGMNEVLLKPLRLNDLRLALERYLGDSPAPAPAATTTEATVSDDAPAVLDPEALDELVDGDDKIRREILDEFVASAMPAADAIRDAAASGDAAGVGAAAHKLKSASASVGAMALSAVCRELEQAGKAGDAATVGARMPAFEEAAAAALAAIKAA